MYVIPLRDANAELPYILQFSDAIARPGKVHSNLPNRRILPEKSESFATDLYQFTFYWIAPAVIGANPDTSPNARILREGIREKQVCRCGRFRDVKRLLRGYLLDRPVPEGSDPRHPFAVMNAIVKLECEPVSARRYKPKGGLDSKIRDTDFHPGKPATAIRKQLFYPSHL